MAIKPVHTFALFSFVLIVHNVTLGPLHSSDLSVWAPGGESQCEVSTQGNLYTVSKLQPLMTFLMFQVPCEAGAVASPRVYLASVSPLSLGVLVVIVLSLGLGLTVIRRLRRQTEQTVEGEEGVELQVIFRQ